MPPDTTHANDPSPSEVERTRLAGVRDRVRRRFEVDTRSLAVLRIALGIILLVDLCLRAGRLELFYTDAGVYPMAAHEAAYAGYAGVSLHAFSGELWFQQFLFVVAGAFAVAFLVGYRTRLVGLVSFVLLVSLHARNPAVLNGGDRLLRVLVVVALVTPLGERWSVDALRRGAGRERVASVGTVALLLQPVVVFTANAIEKHGGEEWYAGDGLEIAVHNDVMTTTLGAALADHAALLTLLNYGWVTLIAGSAVFLLVPVGRLRAASVAAYVSGFVGMGLTLSVGLFPLVLVAAVVAFLPGLVWDALSRRVPATVAERRLSAAALGPLGRPPAERRLLSGDREGTVAAGVVACGRSLLTVLGICVLVWMLAFSASTVAGHDVPDAVDYEHLDQQRWGLYAPDPTESYDWYVSRAYLTDGSTANAFGDGPVEFDRPPDPSAAYETFRHRKFMSAVGRAGADGAVAKSYADWVCERADETHDASVERIIVYRMHQPSPLDGKYEEPTRHTVIERDCAAA